MYPVMYSLSVRLPPACSSERSNDGSADKYAALLFSGLPRKNSRPSVHSGVAVKSSIFVLNLTSLQKQPKNKRISEGYEI
jgi:hypothetical protein